MCTREAKRLAREPECRVLQILSSRRASQEPGGDHIQSHTSRRSLSHPRPCGQTCDPNVGTPEGIARDTCDTAIVPLLDRESPVCRVRVSTRSGERLSGHLL